MVIVEFHVKVCSLQIKSLQKQASNTGNLFLVAVSTRYKFSCCSVFTHRGHLLLYLAEKLIRVRLSLDWFHQYLCKNGLKYNM